MKKDNLMQILHDRATRGEDLLETEKTRLSDWYETQDKLEKDLLTKNLSADIRVNRKKQIQTVLTEIANFSNKIQTLIAQNEILRRENETLREKLVQNPMRETV
ncbi:MAG: DNA replication initiation control protein YabA [Acidobacteriota bacterium]|nr:DNA replication initiation control protein YabA [Acidobacteriota bacterium]